MKKIARLREQWSHRRTVSAPHATSNQKAEPVPVLGLRATDEGPGFDAIHAELAVVGMERPRSLHSMEASRTQSTSALDTAIPRIAQSILVLDYKVSSNYEPSIKDTNTDPEHLFEDPENWEFPSIHNQEAPVVTGLTFTQHALDDSADDGLCKRCRGLQLESLTKPGTTSKLGMIATIRKSFIRDDCGLCVQFANIFGAFANPGSKTIERQEFDLHCHRLRKGDQSDSCNEIYFNLHCKNPTRDIRLLPMHGNGDEIPFEISRVITPDRPNFEFVRESLTECRLNHSVLCTRPPAQTTLLRLIDCKTRRLIVAEPNQQYVCLSYVWGRDVLQQAECFAFILPKFVPKTVEDAMFVAVNIGIPYLWVDRYCIDQGNPHEKHDVIRQMDRIYKGAEITIIAISGDNPHYGLPGIRGTPRKPQPILQVGGQTFLAAEEVAGHINGSKWSLRGWTFQEMLLSRRRLVFTDSQMYFQCAVMHCIESLCPSITSPGGPFSSLFRVFPQLGIGRSALELRRRLNTYYSRHLSFNADSVNAFVGIVNAFNDTTDIRYNAAHFYGVLVFYSREDQYLARTSFLTSLSWTLGLQTDNQPNPLKRTDMFPSWTWASIKADRSEHALGNLHQTFHPAKNALLHHKNISILVTHRSLGEMDISAFTVHEVSWESYFPYIDISSWVFECRYNSKKEATSFLDSCISIEDASAYNQLTFCLIYLGVYDTHSVQSNVIVLVVQEVKPGVFTRVGIRVLAQFFLDETITSIEDLLLRVQWEDQVGNQATSMSSDSRHESLRTNSGVLWQAKRMRIV